MSREGTRRPRVLIDPSSHHLLNAGDVAMLQVCVERLCANRPDVEIEVLTSAPELLADHCPGARPIPATGRYAMIGSTRPTLPGPRLLARLALSHHARRAARREPAARTFANSLLAADLLLLSGRGGLTDAFPEETDAMLGELEVAGRIGLPTALVGQGIGPLEEPRARGRMAAALGRVELVSLREGRAAPPLLAAIGVPDDRIAVTGDDAIEPSFRARPHELGAAIGLNVRVADYAGVGPNLARRIGSTVGRRARGLGADVVSVGISSHPHEDEASAAQGAGVPALAIDRPSTAIGAAGRCRVVVAGSYHACVFALSQGVPVVGLASSPYYVDKLLGLRERFGEGCAVVRLDDPDALGEAATLAAIGDELEHQWRAAPTLRAALLAGAERQVELSRAAHQRAAAAIASADGAAERRPAAVTAG